MAAQPYKGSTSTLVTRFRLRLSDVLERTGLGPPATLIHNESEKPIFLIPVSRRVGGAGRPSLNIIKNDLAKEIRGKENRIVYGSWYTGSGVNSGFEICILFRGVSGNTYNLQDFLSKHRESIELEQGEKPLLPEDLSDNRHLYLTYNGQKVIEVKNDGQDGERGERKQAEQTSESLVTATQEGSAPVNLIEEGKSLNTEVEDLKKRVKKLEDLVEIMVQMNC